ncbi:hypothetical protein PS1_045033 [Malus domestica]
MDLYGRSPARSFNKRPMKGWKGRSSVKARSQRSISRSPPYSRSPVKVSRSRSPVSRNFKLHIPIVTPLLNLLQAGIIMLRSADLSNEQMATYSQAGSYAN